MTTRTEEHGLTALEALPVSNDGTRDYVYDLPTLDDPTRANANGIGDPSDPARNGRHLQQQGLENTAEILGTRRVDEDIEIGEGVAHVIDPTSKQNIVATSLASVGPDSVLVIDPAAAHIFL